MDADNVDRRLVELFEASRELHRARRELLPPVWLNAEREPGDHLAEVFEDVVARAHEHVRTRREAVRPDARRIQSQA